MSLKELKNRILSVQSTLKIASAMRMISSAKMHKAQMQRRKSRPYRDMLAQTLFPLLSNKEEDYFMKIPLMQKGGGKRKVLIAIASDSSLCGAYNMNVIKFVRTFYETEKENILRLYCVGKKLQDAFKRLQIPFEDVPEIKPAVPDRNMVRSFAKNLVEEFLQKKVDEVQMIFTQSRNIAQQEIKRHVLLPYTIRPIEQGDVSHKSKSPFLLHHLLEPNEKEVVDSLIQSQVEMDFITNFQHASFSEHASRMMAMQTAEDNANELLNTLQVQYNKLRQSAITAELLDMTGALMS